MTHPWALLATAVIGVGTLIYVAVTMYTQNQNQPHGHDQRGRRRRGSGDSTINHPWYTRCSEDEEEENRKKSRKSKSKSTGQQQDEDNVLKCSICLESFNDLVNGGHSLCAIESCRHIFCEKCIKASLRRTASCPKCRKPATVKNLQFIYM